MMGVAINNLAAKQGQSSISCYLVLVLSSSHFGAGEVFLQTGNDGEYDRSRVYPVKIFLLAPGDCLALSSQSQSVANLVHCISTLEIVELGFVAVHSRKLV
jgi:hypothetical protein